MMAEGLDTLFVGCRIIRLEQVDSSNSFALNMLRGMPLEEGTVVVAEKQTRGRGQRGNSWDTEAGQNLTLSVVLKPAFLQPVAHFNLTRIIALAVRDTVHHFLPGFDVKIKWPNDIMVNGKKVAGILIENVLQGERIQWSVAGIGLNVNQSSFPQNLPNACSMSQMVGANLNLDDVFRVLCVKIEQRYIQLRSSGNSFWKNDYQSQLFRKGERTCFSNFSELFYAVPERVDDSGMLILSMDDGTTRSFGFKELAWII